MKLKKHRPDSLSSPSIHTTDDSSSSASNTDNESSMDADDTGSMGSDESESPRNHNHAASHQRAASYQQHHSSSTSHSALPAPRAQLPYKPSQVHVEFNDGTVSPLPADLHSYWMRDDPYTIAYNCMSEKDEQRWFESVDYLFWLQKVQQGKLVVETHDLTSVERWQALGFFLAKSPEVLSVKFLAVDLQKSELIEFTKILLQCALANATRRPRKRTKDGSGHTNYSSSSSSPSVTSTDSSPTIASEGWTGGWGVSRQRERYHDLRLKHLTFTDNNLGTTMHLSDEELARQRELQQADNSYSSYDALPHASTNALENVISFLLFCELLETCNIWRNNLSDQHAIKLSEAILLKHPSLRTLSLRYNGITADGAQQIEQILHTMSTNVQSSGSETSTPGARFEELDLAFNRIDPARHSQLFRDAADVATNSLPSSRSSSRPASRPATPKASSISVAATRALPIPVTPQAISAPQVSLPPRRPLYTVNLRNQMPHSARLLSHYLGLTGVPSRYDSCKAMPVISETRRFVAASA